MSENYFFWFRSGNILFLWSFANYQKMWGKNVFKLNIVATDSLKKKGKKKRCLGKGSKWKYDLEFRHQAWTICLLLSSRFPVDLY